MYEELLREIGLSPNEARVYEALLATGEASVQTISNKSGVHRRNVYDALTKLMEKGLASQAAHEKERHFRATDPELLMTLLKEKEDRLAHKLPEMKKQFQDIKQEEQAYIYRGVQGFRNYMQDILDVSEDFFSIGAKGGWYDPRLKAYRLRFYKELKKKKLNCYHLMDWEMRKHIKTDTESPVHEHLEQTRFLPPNASTKASIDFFGDRIVTFTGLTVNKLDDNMVEFVLISRKLCEAYKKWFWFMWENAIPTDKLKEYEGKLGKK